MVFVVIVPSSWWWDALSVKSPPGPEASECTHSSHIGFSFLSMFIFNNILDEILALRCHGQLYSLKETGYYHVFLFSIHTVRDQTAPNLPRPKLEESNYMQSCTLNMNHKYHAWSYHLDNNSFLSIVWFVCILAISVSRFDIQNRGAVSKKAVSRYGN